MRAKFGSEKIHNSNHWVSYRHYRQTRISTNGVRIQYIPDLWKCGQNGQQQDAGGF